MPYFLYYKIIKRNKQYRFINDKTIELFKTRYKNMAKYNVKKAPKGWIYPLSLKKLKKFVIECNANFMDIDFQGTTKPSEFLGDRLWCWIGILKAKRENNEWYFNLQINCLKEEHVIPWKDEIQDLLIEEIGEWINNKLDLLPTAPEKPTSLYLKYEIFENTCESSCFEVD